MPSTATEPNTPRRRRTRRTHSTVLHWLMVAAIFSAVIVVMFAADLLLHAKGDRGESARPSPSPSPSIDAAGDVTPSPEIAPPIAGPSEPLTAPTAEPDTPPAFGGVPAPEGGKELSAEGENGLPPEGTKSAAGSVVPDNIDEVAVAEGETADIAWFSDAVLIGDSRVDGFRLYSGVRDADYIVRAGMSVYEVAKEKKNISVGGTKYSVYQLLGKKQYAKVYLSIGINELGYYDPEGYAKTYQKIIDKVTELQPDAQIYVMTLIPVNTDACTESKQQSYINNDQIRQYNAALVEMAAEQDVLLVNAAEALAGEDGELLGDMTSDGVHFTRDGYAAWRDYLLCHTGT